MPTFNHASFLAARAQVAATITVVLPDRFALVGAKAPVAADRLEALQESGRDHGQIVDHINAQWAKDHAAQLAQHQRWVTGTYDRMVAMEKQARADALRKNAERAAAIDRALADLKERDDAGNA